MSIQNWLRRRRWLHLWLPVVAWMALIFSLSAQRDLPHPEAHWASLLISGGAHAFMFGILAMLWARALVGRPRTCAFCVTVLYALSDEFHQLFVPGRTADPVDLLCDALGALAGLWLWAHMQGRLRA
jgi:VanZ family protein